MLKTNSPAPKGEAIVCLLGGDTDGHTTRDVRVQHLLARLPLTNARAELIARLAWDAMA